MFKKPTLIAMLITWALANTAYASGSHSHPHGHGKQTHDSQKQKISDSAHDRHSMKGTDRDNAHQHRYEGSQVGQPVSSVRATKTIRVTTMDSMRFEFSSKLDLNDGDIIKFEVSNQCKIPHEFSIGDAIEQQAHRDIMRKMPNMTHEDGNTITVKPGETKELTWQFKAGKEVVFACNIPGHFEAGMFEKVDIISLQTDKLPYEQPPSENTFTWKSEQFIRDLFITAATLDQKGPKIGKLMKNEAFHLQKVNTFFINCSPWIYRLSTRFNTSA